ncbi:MAG TPA: thiamine-phosphate kinase [Solirubrobacterales bacterium]|nr:thiamine-phosphate kinase [Solirubrobacterales bacterium]
MGEFELLERIRERLGAGGSRVAVGSGDDASVTVPGGATATSVDALVEGVHFRRDHASLAQIGHKALATALSDLAAMGAEPGEAYVFLGVPASLDEAGVLELLDGMLELAEQTGTTLAGGDISRAPALTLATTVVGHAAAPRDFVTRAGAREGDVLAVTGELGGAAAGLLLLEKGADRAVDHTGAGLTAQSVVHELVERQLAPTPRIAAGQALARVGATAMIDISDGLGGDARHLAAASEVGLRIDASALPLNAGLREVAAAVGGDPLELAVSGGEDYELLATLPPDRFERAVEAVVEAGTTLARVGDVARGEGVEIRLPGGEPLKATGFDQLG